MGLILIILAVSAYLLLKLISNRAKYRKTDIVLMFDESYKDEHLGYVRQGRK